MTISDLSGGGAEREFANLLHFLDPVEFDVHVCLWRPVFNYAVPEGIPVTVLNKTKPWHVVRAIKLFAHLVDSFKPDIVFSMLHFVNIITGTALAIAHHRPAWVCRFNSNPEIEISGIKKYWARQVVPRADCVVGCSAGVARSLLKHLDLDSTRVRTTYNPVDIEIIERLSAEPLPIEKPRDAFVIAHAGRFSPEKNQTMLLQAVSQMKHKSIELWMLGQGPMEGDLKREAARLKIAGRVRWLGFQKNPFPFMRAADCFALSSIREGLPTAIVEAMACGTAVVSTLCPYGPDELIENGKTGFLVPMHDAGKLVEVLDRLASDDAMRTNLGKNAAREVREKFNRQRFQKEHIALFKALVQPAGG